MNRRRKIISRILLVFGLLTSPLTLLVLLGVFNPFALVFLYPFQVENKTNEPIWITPLGTVGEEGLRQVLPQYLFRTPALPALKEADLRIDPGETRHLIYDWDDINFSEIVVKSRRGEQRMLVVDSHPTENRYHTPGENHFVIDSFERLEPLTGAISETVLSRRWNFATPMFLLLGALPVALLAGYKLLNRNPDSNKKNTSCPTEIPIAGV